MILAASLLQQLNGNNIKKLIKSWYSYINFYIINLLSCLFSMKTNIKNILLQVSLCLLFLFFSQNTIAQKTENRIAVFAPIFLDSAFNGNTFKIWENSLPKNMLPGLEFFNGIQMAIDSLQKEGINNLIVDIYDYKSKGNSLLEIVKNTKNKLSTSTIIIASFNKYTDIKILADFANKNKIPLISASFPNEGGVNNNPYFFLLNPTIQTHVNAIYKNLVANYKQTNIVYIKCKGAFENWVDNSFIEFEENTSIDKRVILKPITFSDSFTSKELFINLDSNFQNTIVCNCSKEVFAQKVIKELSSHTNYNTTVLGLPTWDSYNISDGVNYKDVPVIHTSAYNFSNLNYNIENVIKAYENQYYLKPSDQFFKGFETMLRVGKTVSLYHENAITLFSDNLFRVFNELIIQPHYNKVLNTQVDYFENTKIYHIKKLNGQIVSVD